MSIYKVKLRKTDRLWTEYMRKKYDYTCQFCGKQYTPDNCRNLGVSHFYGRARESTRFDIDNCILLCSIPCHHYLDTHKNEYREFMLKRLGKERYDLLEWTANMYKKRDDAAEEIRIKQLLKELK